MSSVGLTMWLGLFELSYGQNPPVPPANTILDLQAPPRLNSTLQAPSTVLPGQYDAESIREATAPVDQIQKVMTTAEGLKSATQVVHFHPVDVYTVFLRVGAISLITLPFSEEIQHAVLGDDTVFQMQFLKNSGRPANNVLALSTSQMRVDTNLVIFTTSQKIINFWLRSIDPNSTDHSPTIQTIVTTAPLSFSTAPVSSSPSGREQNQRGTILHGAGRTSAAGDRVPYQATEYDQSRAVIDELGGAAAGQSAPNNDVWAYGRTEDISEVQIPAASNVRQREQPDVIRQIKFDPTNLRFGDYAILLQTPDARAIAPVRVYHDGIYTYLDFEDENRPREGPSIRQVIDEIDSPVNWEVLGANGDRLAVHTIGDFTLRAGDMIVCIVYEGPDYQAEETIAPAVKVKEQALDVEEDPTPTAVVPEEPPQSNRTGSP